MENELDESIEVDEELEGQAEGGGDGASGSKERSSIAFPYVPLDDAIPVAKAIHDQGGGSGSISQLAAWLNHDSVKSGAFRMKLAGARIFGLIRVDRTGVSLTELGRQIVDPAGESAAKVKAFLSVPLYRKTFEKFDGYPLPPDTGLEAEFVRIGVAEKQKARARQVFQRSAKQAGFFPNGKQRLVMPKVAGAEPKPPEPVEPQSPKINKQEPDHQPHPLIAALFKTVPEAGAPWDVEARDSWLSTAKSIFDLVYRD